MGDFFDTLSSSLPDVALGLRLTVEATVLGALLSLVLAFVLGFMTRSRHLLVRGVARFVVEFFRGTSLLVQLFWLYFALPLLGFRLDSLLCGVLALGLNFGAYGSEVVRGALNAVPTAQSEATVALNMTPLQRMRLVILPQAWVQMIPSFTNLLIQLLKSSPLLSLISMTDVTYQMQHVRADSGNTALSFLTLLLIYFVLAYLMTLLMNALEVVAKGRLGQGEGLRAAFRMKKTNGQVTAVSGGVPGGAGDVSGGVSGGKPPEGGR